MRSVLLVAVSLMLAGCIWHRGPKFPAPIPPLSASPRTAFALRYIDIAQGTGTPVAPRKCLYARYTGWLANGKQFDASRDPIAFLQGGHRVIAGWDLGFDGMRVGGKRRLIIPYQLAYGERGSPPVIPPRAELIFDVELMAVADTVPGQACPNWAEVRAR